jgi:hypothetical protein
METKMAQCQRWFIITKKIFKGNRQQLYKPLAVPVVGR